jgi:fibronectin type 3 domain-containing protein
VARLPQLNRRRTKLILCPLLLGGLSLSAPLCGHGLPSKTALQNRAPHSHSVDLKWRASASRVIGYNVYRSDKAEGPFTKLSSSPIQATDYKDGTVQPGHTYFYKVTAVDSQGHESAFSTQIKAVVPSP